MYGDDGFKEQVAQEQRAYDAGRHARLMGRPASANPFKHTDTLWPEWDAGWEDADYSLLPSDRRYESKSCGCSGCLSGTECIDPYNAGGC